MEMQFRGQTTVVRGRRNRFWRLPTKAPPPPRNIMQRLHHPPVTVIKRVFNALPLPSANVNITPPLCFRGSILPQKNISFVTRQRHKQCSKLETHTLTTPVLCSVAHFNTCQPLTFHSNSHLKGAAILKQFPGIGKGTSMQVLHLRKVNKGHVT